jgi:hypothetical protein
MKRNKYNNYGKKGKTDFYLISYIPKGHRTSRIFLAGRDLKKVNDLFTKKYQNNQYPTVYKFEMITGNIIKI